MKAPATSGARVSHGQARKPATKRAAAKPAASRPAARKAAVRKPAARKPAGSKKRGAEPEIKITRRSPRPQIKASRGTGTTDARRRSMDRAAATRRQSLNSLNADYSRSARGGANSSGPVGAGAARAVAIGAGGAAAGAVRVASEVARPAAAAARPMLRVISGGIDKLPTGSASQPIARGRMLILIAGVLAAGLIYINVGKLEAGDGYGKYAQRSLELQRENTALRARVSYLSSAERIQTYAKRFGMVAPAPEQYTYLRPKRGDALKGSRSYTAPTATNATPTAAPTAAPQQASGTAPTNQPAVGATEQIPATTGTGATAVTGGL